MKNQSIPAPTSSSSSESSPPAIPKASGKTEVARVAYELWQKYDCPSGRDEIIWLEAEHMVARGGVAKGKGRSTKAVGKGAS